MGNFEQQTSETQLRGGFALAFAAAKMLEAAASNGMLLEQLAYYDELTGARNRRGIKDYLSAAQAPKGLLNIDSTNFKAVNDRLGHETGDKVLVDTHAILAASVRPDDIIGRWGGDEWVVILNGEGKPTSATGADRRVNIKHSDYIHIAKQRISVQMQQYLEQNPTLQTVNFDLAVGGVVWEPGYDIEELIARSEADLMAHKKQQHTLGQYRRVG